MSQLREDLVKGGAPNVTASALSPDDFQIANVPPEQDALLRQAATSVETLYDRESGHRRHLHVPVEAECREPSPPGDGGSGAANDRTPRQ